ncbi:MAG: NAD(P)-binding protein [Pseudomonadota bacterium]
MNSEDRNLGMGCKITRRDLLQGMGATAGMAILPRPLAAAPAGHSTASYPPAETGMRGNHPGSWETAHALARNGVREWGDAQTEDESEYDLVVVGAGISGLAAAWFWRKERPDARILILDNHDDFGGHARRNEFSVGGRTLLGCGGSQNLVAPDNYPLELQRMLRELSVDTSRFEQAYDDDFYQRHNLAAGIYFDEAGWGTRKLLRYKLANVFENYIPVAETGLSHREAAAKLPMPDAARAQALNMLSGKGVPVPGDSEYDRWQYLATMTYREFMVRHYGVSEEAVFRLFQNMTYDSGSRIDTTAAFSAIFYGGLPGIELTGVTPEDSVPYRYHFPDGNASIARLLVRQMIPAAAAGDGMEDIVTATMDYGKLDRRENSVRLRLNSTVVEVAHRSSAKHSEGVEVSYVRAGTRYSVRAGQVVLACYNAMIPSLCQELPVEQKAAMARQVKVPILYTSVAVRNWQAWKKLGVGAVMCPSSYHVKAILDFPVSIGDYAYSNDPDEPTLVHMQRFMLRNADGMSRHQQYRLGRHELMTTPFEEMEREIRRQLGGMLSEGGFDPAADIAGITVNRWAHGYSSWYSEMEDEMYEDWDDPRYPHVKARQPYGRIAVANSDAGASAMLETAVMQAHRAVGELL